MLTPCDGLSAWGPPAQGGKFTIGGANFVFAGWNQWEVLEVGPDAHHLPPGSYARSDFSST